MYTHFSTKNKHTRTPQTYPSHPHPHLQPHPHAPQHSTKPGQNTAQNTHTHTLTLSTKHKDARVCYSLRYAYVHVIRNYEIGASCLSLRLRAPKCSIYIFLRFTIRNGPRPCVFTTWLTWQYATKESKKIGTSCTSWRRRLIRRSVITLAKPARNVVPLRARPHHPHLITAAPQLSPAPKPAQAITSPSLTWPLLTAAASAMGMEPAEVFPCSFKFVSTWH
jgi:hypothetical protein